MCRLIWCFLSIPCWIPLVSSATRVLPPIEITLQRPEGLNVPVSVSLFSRRAYRWTYTELDQLTIEENRGSFSARTTGKLGWLVLKLTWKPDRLPTRELVYEIRARRGKRMEGGRGIRLNQDRAFFQIEAVGNGDCVNLFTYKQQENRLLVEIALPKTYLACRDSGQKLADLAAVGNRDINVGTLNYYKFDDDLRMGQQFYSQIGKAEENPPLQDPLVNDYVRDLVQRIGRASDMPELEFNVTVIDADVLNAFAVPGGFIWVYRGLIENTETEAELAGVIAHEIAHVTSRHGTEGVTSAINKVALGTIAGAVLADQTDEDWLAGLIQTAVLGGTQFWIVGGTRKREAEADKLGVQYAWRAGYDPRGIATLFQRWSMNRNQPQTRLDQLFSDHPNDEVRVANVMRDVGYFLPPKDGLIESTPQYHRVKAHLKTLPPPKQRGDQAGNALFSAFSQVNEQILFDEIGEYLTSGKPLSSQQ